MVATGRLCSSDGCYLDTTGIIPERQFRSNGCNAQPVTNVTFRSDVPHAPIARVLEINGLETITDDVIEAAASILVIGN